MCFIPYLRCGFLCGCSMGQVWPLWGKQNSQEAMWIPSIAKPEFAMGQAYLVWTWFNGCGSIPTTQDSVFTQVERAGYGMAREPRGEDQGSFFPFSFNKIQTLCLKNFLKARPSLGLCRCFFLLPLAWVSDVFCPACPSQTLSVLDAFRATAVTA